MVSTLPQIVPQLLEQAGVAYTSVASLRPIGGGCISQTTIIELPDSRRFFLKSQTSGLAMFLSERRGLEALRQADCIRVPQVVGVGEGSDGIGVILLEEIGSGVRGSDFSFRFGQQLARLHRNTTRQACGFDEDNFIGSTPQMNQWYDQWVPFWRTCRFGYQLQLAEQKGLLDVEFRRRFERLDGRLDELLSFPDERPVLLHGDLWSGNFLVDEHGAPVLIDPAVYYGRREAEFGMIKLFGGFDQRFMDGYNDVWPLEKGHAERFEVYKLYHLLNHLNLFGSGYLSGCHEILRSLT